MSTQTALPDVRRQLVQARDDQMAQVVALVDALPQRGQADLLIAPLRPRLALLAPSRPMTVTRLMFRPLDPVIVPGPRWRPGMPAVLRTALGCLGAAVMPRLGAAGMTIQAMLAGLPPGAPADTARDAAARAGAMLWPAAAAVLDNLLTPPDWTDSTGLPPSCFGPIRAAAAAVLHQAACLARLDAGGEVDIAAGVNAILVDAQSRPGGLTTVLAVLLAHGPSAALLAGAMPGSPPGGASPGLAALPTGALDSAVEQSLNRAGTLVETVLPGVALGVAARHAGDVAALVAALDHPASRPSLRVQAGRTRQAADQACRSRMAQAVQQDMIPRLLEASNEVPLDDAAVGRLESVARDLRRLGQTGRRLGQPAAYDALMTQIAKEIGGLSAPGLTRMDRLRMAELLVGAQAALRLVPEGIGRSFGNKPEDTAMPMTRRTALRTALGSALALPYVRHAHAEVSTVLIAKQFGTLYLQQDVMEQQGLVQKHGAAVGLPGLQASFLRFAGTGPITEALLAGSLHFASGGAPGALLLWDRTRGTVKSAFAMNATNQRLLTVNPAIRTIRDITPADRIALPAVKVSPQAIYLQMAAAKEWGANEWSRLDAQTIGRAHPDSMAAMLGKSEITCHFSTTPFQERELATPGVREVLNSYDVQGVQTSTPNTIYASSSFRAGNPLAWRATLAAFQEATDWINANPADAAQLYLTSSGDKDTPANVQAAMGAPGNRFTLQPSGVVRLANFMADTGVLKRRPEKLEDLFFPEAMERGGS